MRIPCLLILVFITSIVFCQEQRLALVIGNALYENGSTLLNPENDANAMADALQQLGFDVLKHENLDQDNMRRAIDEFGAKLREYDVGLFFYAGHGIQAKGMNYLIPVDAEIWTENDVEYNCVAAGRVLAKMEDAESRIKIVILDACRDNPFERSWTRSVKGTGLAFMNAPYGSIIAYATAPGSTASDGLGAHGLYTSALLENLMVPGLQIEDVFKRVRVFVREQSNGRQVPWESTSLEGDFYFYLQVTENEESAEEPVFLLVQSMPSFQGEGMNGFRTWVSRNLKYPEAAAENGISGTVWVQFAVNSKGDVVDAVVVGSVDPALDEEAVRVVMSSPKWTPGKHMGKPVKVHYTFRINFEL